MGQRFISYAMRQRIKTAIAMQKIAASLDDDCVDINVWETPLL